MVTHLIKINPHNVVINMLNCEIIVSEFELQLDYYFQTNTLGKDMNHLIPTVKGLIASLQFFYNGSFGIK